MFIQVIEGKTKNPENRIRDGVLPAVSGSRTAAALAVQHYWVPWSDLTDPCTCQKENRMETIESQVDELIAQMTPAEKAGQLTQYFYFRLPAGARAPALDFDADEQPRMVESALRGGRRGFAAVRHRSGRDQPPATARGRR